MRWIKRVVAGLLALVLIVCGAVAIYAWRSVPTDSASFALAAKLSEATITLDTDGIPLIEAKSERDLAFSVGFMHARDRLWQLEVNRRIGRGELAEILGPKALDTDKFLRTVGVHHAATRQLAKFPEADQALLQAYADGVNAYVAGAMTVRPPEFVILGVQPGKWEPVDTVAWALIMAMDLGGNWSNELLRLQMSARMPVSRIDELLPPQPGDKFPPHGDYAALYKSIGLIPQSVAVASAAVTADPLYLSFGTEGIGSNNWVVNGANTMSGKPLLANDPHLSLAAPAIWYYAKLKAPGVEVTGATLPGGPAVVLGRTKGVAWGFTNTGPDVQDLYIEEINDKGEARTPDGWAKLASRNETIKVKGEADTQITVRESRHGPILSDVNAPLAAAINSKKFAIALQWTALDADNQTALVAPRMNKAQTVAEAKETLRTYIAPQQNMVFADTLGNTAFIAAGRVPIRKPENDINGLAPSPGWDAKYDWSGFVPFDQLPQQTVTSYLATANQRIHADDYPHFISGEWAHPGRKLRIEELLAAKLKHDAQGLREIQHDVRHTHDLPLLQRIDKLPTDTFKRQMAIAGLRAFHSDRSAGAPTFLYWAWTRALTRKLFSDEVGTPLFEAIYGRRDFRAAMNNAVAKGDAWWCDDKNTKTSETCESIIVEAFDEAIRELERRCGEINEVEGLTSISWSHAHFARSEHRPFSNVPLLAKLFEIRTPTAGDTYTVMVGKVRLKEPNPFANEFAASMRAVYDLSIADANAATIIYSTGQSGNPFSSHYRDLARRWGSGGAGAYIDLARGEAKGTIVLRGQ
ncbi:MAG TPA: penicillin acylase family protein [Casimicrobium sp.]|nr:penicillin acylase family protein [Casimicrobium sp.]